jgi:hypothetical protein
VGEIMQHKIISAAVIGKYTARIAGKQIGSLGALFIMKAVFI